MLSAKNIYKKYGPVEVLKGVDIAINPGEIVSIVGPSGSGKSTLLHILGTLDRADKGVVEFSGVRIDSKPDADIKAVIWWKRLLNLVIDGVIIGTIANLFFYFYSGHIPAGDEYSTSLFLNISVIIIYLLYYWLMEGFTGRTLAKFITGSKVMMESDFSKPRFLTCLFRSLSRLIPLEPFSFLSKRPIGLHDIISSTIVADSHFAYQNNTGLSGQALSDFRNKKIGFVFQFHHLLPEFSALENVCIPGWITNSNKKEVQERAERLLKILGLADRLHNKPNQLSGGEQQRVAVARALINKPDIVFADEPTGNLDTVNAKELHQLFFDLRKELNQTFLIVTHNEELAQLSDRTLTMKDGKII
jgi:ABC-type lipoprotein export system ATPase subunit